MRILGLDFGTRTCGVAISDENGIIAQPLSTIERERPNKLRQTCAAIEQIIEEYGVEKLVLGYPVLLNGDKGERAIACEEFKEMLERRTGLPVILVDERLTTAQADRILEATGVAKLSRKEHIDKMAAAIILQSYLDGQANS